MKPISLKLVAAVFIVIIILGAPCYAANAIPKITSITFSAPVPLKPGDVITVDLSGTPHTKAAFAVRDFIPVVQMKELSPGSYHGTVKVPLGKTIHNAPLVGYLGEDNNHAAPLQASRLITVIASQESFKPTANSSDNVKSELKPITEPDKLPRLDNKIATEELSKPKPVAKPIDHIAKPIVVPMSAPPPAPVPTKEHSKIILTSPVDGGIIRHAILVKGIADPGSVVRVTITYSNGLSGVLKLAGDVTSQNLSAGKNGEIRMGPIPLDGSLATQKLKFTIKAYYPDRPDHATAEVSVIGDRL